MNLTIGLDIGGTTTKVVAFSDDELIGVDLVRASDPQTAACGGVGKFLNQHGYRLSDVQEIEMTGVGASYIRENEILGIPTRRSNEFIAVGLGGLYLSGLERAIVVSMGTGTSIVAARRDEIHHVIGSGIGGGSLTGLAHAMLHVSDFEIVTQLAEEGDLSKVDLTVADISAADIPGLSKLTTASNFGKVSDEARKEDYALGIVNLVFQSIGTASVLASQLEDIQSIVYVGSLLRIPQGRKCLRRFSELYHVEVIIPEQAEYCTAIGAALSSRSDGEREKLIARHAGSSDAVQQKLP